MADKFEFKGVFPALVTPFDKNEEIDEKALRQLVESVIPNVDGLVPCGTTGEFTSMSFDERMRVLEIVLDQTKGRVPIIAGTGCASTRETIAMTKAAQKAGAAAALVISPFYLHPGDKGVFTHYYKIAHECKTMPIILYNIPQCTDQPLPRTVIEDLAEIPNIIGMKDSSGNLPYTMEVLEKVQSMINVAIGHDEVVVPALAGGCKGMILASAQVIPEIWQKIFKAVEQGDLTEARKLQFSVQKLARIFCRHGGGLAVKEALKMMGIPVGKTRGPLMIGGGLSHEDREEIRMELAKLGKIELPATTFSLERTQTLPGRFGDVGLDEKIATVKGVLLGEGLSGEGLSAVAVDLIAGPKNSAVGEAYAYQLTNPRRGYEALTAILEPNLTVRPPTIILPTEELKSLRQANMIYGPTQLAMSRAIVENIDKKIIPEQAMNTHVMIARVSVHPHLEDRRALYHSVLKAMDQAIVSAFKI